MLILPLTCVGTDGTFGGTTNGTFGGTLYFHLNIELKIILHTSSSKSTKFLQKYFDELSEQLCINLHYLVEHILIPKY